MRIVVIVRGLDNGTAIIWKYEPEHYYKNAAYMKTQQNFFHNTQPTTDSLINR